MPRLPARALRLLALGGSVALLLACQTGRIDVYSCEDPCYECEDPCAVCARGECVIKPDPGWEGPVLLWSGAEGDAPECPESAPVRAYEGYDGLETTQSCPPCACDPASCQPPQGLVASDATCPGDQPGSSQLIIEAPEGWEDGCFETPTVPDGQLASVLFQPPVMGPCAVITGSLPTSGSVSWARFARACQNAKQPGACEEESQHCAPVAGGFRQCVFKPGEPGECPAGYPDKQVFYKGVESNLGCTACTCGAPEGGACAAKVTLHGDPGCSEDLATATVALGQMVCVDVLTTGDLRAFSATLEASSPGACTPAGGEPTGEAKPVDPATFCCTPL